MLKMKLLDVLCSFVGVLFVFVLVFSPFYALNSLRYFINLVYNAQQNSV